MRLKGLSSSVSLLGSHSVEKILEFNLWAATEYWTATNIADGLTALAICIEVKLNIDGLEPS